MHGCLLVTATFLTKLPHSSVCNHRMQAARTVMEQLHRTPSLDSLVSAQFRVHRRGIFRQQLAVLLLVEDEYLKVSPIPVAILVGHRDEAVVHTNLHLGHREPRMGIGDPIRILLEISSHSAAVGFGLVGKIRHLSAAP